jgi:glutamate/tyrosine decarboxylase-like PLP-dependent enzyme
LQYYGSRRIAEAISEDISLAEYLGEVVSNAGDFELLAPVELSICCFRYVSSSETDLDKLNERIMERVQKGGRAYLSNATVNGHFALRACITNFRTTKNDIDETVAAIREAAEVLTQRRKRTT